MKIKGTGLFNKKTILVTLYNGHSKFEILKKNQKKFYSLNVAGLWIMFVLCKTDTYTVFL